ncbi:hypothetical protein FSP39_011560 [Pinctada imbricata]|uniref:RING-type domain-containing protein n=1 Tax=Pinctada imbricata TaxID=66713 RepID=A0AA88YTT9_PINIB|nr:hypothetical protein FSP39_011560 [Pinctada imbricata]
MDVVGKLVKCPLCHTEYNSPRRLPCCHVFCQQCLQSYLSDYLGKSDFPCPVCSYAVIAKNSINDETCANFPCADFEDSLLKLTNTDCNEKGSYVSSKCACGTGNDAIYTTKQELGNMQEVLLPKERQLIRKKEETALGISKYFSDLRLKVTQYLLEQEQKVQEDLESLVSLEKIHLKDELRNCTSMLDSVEQKQSLIMGTLNRTEDSDLNLAHLKLVSSFQSEIERYEACAKEMELETPDARFIINTDLEDAMTSADLIKIEVVNTRQYDRRQEAFTGPESEESSSNNGSNTTLNSESDTASVRSETIETTVESERSPERQNENEAIQVPVPIPVSAFSPDEPPPPYPGPPQSASNIHIDIRVEDSPNQQILPEEKVDNMKNRSGFQHFRPIPSAPPASLTDNVIDHLIIESSGDTLQPSAYNSRPRSSSPRFDRGSGSGSQLRNSGRCHDAPSPVPPRRHSQNSARGDSRSFRDASRFRLKHIWQAHTMAVGEHKAPRIFGMSWLQDGYLLVADRWNHRLKVLKDGMIVHVFSLGQFQPWDIAEMPNNYSAVAVPEAKMIYIVMFEVPDIRIRRKISTRRGYSCISYSSDRRQFVCATISQFSSPGIDIVGTDGQIQSVITPVNAGRNFISYPRGISIFENRIAVTDFQKKTVVFIKLEQRPVIRAKYQGTDTMPLREPNGITLNLRDQYFLIFDSRSGKIHVVSPSGHNLGIVDCTMDHDEPCNAAIDTDRSPPRLAISFGNGTVVTYEIH